MSRYMLYTGQEQAVPMGHSYSRRSQSTLHRHVWKQRAYGGDPAPLIEHGEAWAEGGFDWKVEDWNTGRVVASSLPLLVNGPASA